MNTKIQEGDSLTLIAPTGGVVVGVPVQIGQLLVIPQNTAAQTESFVGATTGVFEIAKDTADATTEGALMYWDNGNSRVTTDSATGLLMVGHCTEVTLAATTPVKIRLDGVARADQA